MKGARTLFTSFVDIFPPPKFLEMPAVGLDISDRNVYFAELKRQHTRFQLGVYGEEKIPEDVVEDGYIKDKQKLVEILSAIRRKYNLTFIHASLPEEKSYLFNTSIPKMAEADIASALRFKIEENVPIAFTNAVYDYRVIKKPLPEENQIRVSMTVVHMKVVSSYVDVFKDAGLTPLSLQIESQAIAHAALPHDDLNICIIVTIRETRTVLSIVSGGEIQFTSTLPVGGELIAASIRKNLNIDQDEVEKIRQGKELRESNEMFLSLVSAATALRDEIQKLIAYWDSHSQEYGQNQRIEKIILTGADSMLGIDDYLSRSLDIKTVIADPWANILRTQDEIPPLLLREALDYIPVLGLALPYD